MRLLIPQGPPQLAGDGDRPGLRRMLLGTRWCLHSDGRLLVVPLPGLARDDLFPLPGRHRRAGGGTEFQAAMVSSDGSARAGLSGRFDPDGAGLLLTASYIIRTRTHDERTSISQPVRPAGPDESPAFAPVGGLDLPAAHAVTLAGATGGETFGPLPAELNLLPATGPEPVEVGLAGLVPGAVGDLTWIASTPGLTQSDTGRLRMTLSGGDLRCELSAPAGAPAVTWIAPMAGPPGLRLGWEPPPLPVAARWALLELRFAAGRVTGEISANGAWGDHVVEYRAELRGERTARPDDPAVLFERAWRTPRFAG
ncbi:hypothetical protein [Micromonospora wenchangensis]|uniref:hypothetical protein n=1 Tax=Micromonospora wenchangensis TaxID=1185415 RepID=UPI0037F9CDDA